MAIYLPEHYVKDYLKSEETANTYKKLTPASIFDVADNSVFIEMNDPAHEEYMHCGKYYEIYYAIAKNYQPRSILEIGVRYGYSLYSMMAACDHLEYVRGYDIDDYEKGSIKIANTNIKKVISKKIDFKVENKDSQKIKSLDRNYDLIHIDGDHSFDGKVHDLELVKNHCKVMVIDDYQHMYSVYRATEKFVEENKDIISYSYSLNSRRGTYVIEFKK